MIEPAMGARLGHHRRHSANTHALQCRCTGYISIVEAIYEARDAYKRKDGA
jgi:aerobic-type carbon monoxide dehydrogenase small subunit (CoxS/CutS family)